MGRPRGHSGPVMFRRKAGFTAIPETALDSYNRLSLTQRATMISLHRYVWVKPHDVHLVCPAGQVVKLTMPAMTTGWNPRQFAGQERLRDEAVRSAVRRVQALGLIDITPRPYCSMCPRHCESRTVYGTVLLDMLTVIQDKQLQEPVYETEQFPEPLNVENPSKTVQLDPETVQDESKTLHGRQFRPLPNASTSASANPVSRTIPLYLERRRESFPQPTETCLEGNDPTGTTAAPGPQAGPLENTPPSQAATLTLTIERRRAEWMQLLVKAGKAHNTVISQPNLSTWAAVLESTGQAMLTAWNTDVAGAVRGLDNLIRRLTVDDQALTRYLNAPRFILKDWPNLVDPQPAVKHWTDEDERKAMEAVRAQRARSERIAALARAESTGTAVEPATAEEVSNV